LLATSKITMVKIIELEIDENESIFVEVNEDTSYNESSGLVAAAGEAGVQKARETFTKAMEKIKPIANTVLSKVKELNEPADEVQVKFGIKMSVKFGAVVTSGGGEANYEVTLKWNKPGTGK
jgi:Trypsin-co-occurring domain 1